jgi:rare lipoprotein A
MGRVMSKSKRRADRFANAPLRENGFCATVWSGADHWGGWRLMLLDKWVKDALIPMCYCLCLAVLLAACGTQTVLPSAQEPVTRRAAPPFLTSLPTTSEASANSSKTVKASYQKSAAAGQRTASGETYNPNDLTAASRNLPLNSTVKVTDPGTGRSVDVRINDRGPFVHGRSLDLSKRAADKIGIIHKGVVRVNVTPVNSHSVSGELESPPPVSKPASPELD